MLDYLGGKHHDSATFQQLEGEEYVFPGVCIYGKKEIK